jgi:hypothetical protein
MIAESGQAMDRSTADFTGSLSIGDSITARCAPAAGDRVAMIRSSGSLARTITESRVPDAV